MEVELHLPPIPDVELVAAKAVEVVGRSLGMGAQHIEATAVATVEACLNALEHSGAGEVLIRVRTGTKDGGPYLEIEVEDHGVGFDPNSVPQAGRSRVHGCVSKRGWGLTLIDELVDEVDVQSRPGLTIVRMRKLVGKGS
ncbi:MAG TPA: ATP-binding protein [Acidobacteria bacterium]|nr:ATP-binding protein [Acidobacteriota bacterium]